jgi:hypothetical protein
MRQASSMVEDGSITVKFPQEPDQGSEEVPYEEGATIAEINNVEQKLINIIGKDRFKRDVLLEGH